MVAIEMMPGGHGDALVVEYGTPPSVKRLLIDAGTVHAYERVKSRLLERNDRRYEAFVITHVDEDHIGGAVPLLEDTDLRHRVRQVWFNGFVHSKAGGNVLGPVDGERLTRQIVDGGYDWNVPFPGASSVNVGGPVVVPSVGDLPTFTLPGDATVYLLSPTGPRLKRMAKVWDDVVTEAGLVPGEGTDRDGRAPKPYEKKVKALPDELSEAELDALAAPTKVDGSPANASSIAFILEYKGVRALLAGDALPTTLVKGLTRFAAMKGEARARIDLCKLPHHGSRANVTTELIAVMDCPRYLVSTDGLTFGHPDDAALARVIRTSAQPAELYFNYRTPRAEQWVTRAAAHGATVVLPGEDAEGLRVEVP